MILALIISPLSHYTTYYPPRRMVWVTQKVNERKLLLKTDNDVNNKVYNDIADEEEVINYKHKKARELMQLQADAFFKNQKGAL